MKVSNIDGWPGYYINKSGRLYSNKRGKWTRIRGELCNNRIQYRLYKRINIDLLGKRDLHNLLRGEKKIPCMARWVS